MGRCQTRQRGGKNFTGGEVASLGNPEKGRAGKRRIKRCSPSKQRDNR